MAQVDPRMQTIAAVKDLGNAHSKMKGTLDNLAEIVNQFKANPTMTTGVASVEAFQKIIPEMRRRGQQLLEHEEQISHDFREVIKKSQQAEQKFLSLADYYVVASGKYTKDEEVHAHYLTLSRGANAAAAAKSNAATYYAEMSSTWHQQLRKVERILLFMSEMENYLAMFPDSEAELRIREQLTNLQQFVGDFEKLMGSFGGFTETLENSGGSGKSIPVPPTA